MIPNLLDWQRGFAAAIDGRDDTIAAWVEPHGLDAGSRLAIYRHANEATYTRALRESYPTVLALLGEEYFDHLGAIYRHEHPSRGGNLQNFGAHFAEFLDAFAPVNPHPPYIADSARLDWLRQLAALAADAAPVDRERRAAAAASDPERLSVSLHPSVGLLRSDYPVWRIHLWCQAPSSPAPHLEDGAESVLVWREHEEVAAVAVAAASAAFIGLLQFGRSIRAAAALALDVDHEFDVAECVGALLARDLIIGFGNIEKMEHLP